MKLLRPDCKEEINTRPPNRIDGVVRRIATTYEVRGMVEKVTSYANATEGSGNTVNEALMVCNDFGQLTSDYQSQSGSVDTGSPPSIEYGYANGIAKIIRPTTMTYTNGRLLNNN